MFYKISKFYTGQITYNLNKTAYMVIIKTTNNLKHFYIDHLEVFAKGIL